MSKLDLVCGIWRTNIDRKFNFQKFPVFMPFNLERAHFYISDANTSINYNELKWINIGVDRKRRHNAPFEI